MEKLINDFSLGLFVWQVLLFVLLILLLKKFAWKPILDSVNEREETIKNSIEEAKKAREEMASLQSSNEKLLIQARKERDSIIQTANNLKKDIVESAKTEAELVTAKELQNAKDVINSEKLAAKNEIKNQIAILSMGIAENILKGNLDDKSKQEKLISSMVNDIKI